VSGGWHIHTGFTCDDHDSVGGHYFAAGEPDPWDEIPVTYTSDASGVAEISLTIPGFSLNGDMPVLGRALVVHNAANSRVGCGLIVPHLGMMARLGKYNDYTGTTNIKGLVSFSESDTGVTITGTLTGLQAGVTGGYHVHSGYSCDKKTGVFGHYYSGDSDPWLTTQYTSDSTGVAQLSYTAAGFSLSTMDMQPVFGRTFVVHSTEASPAPRAGCGVIGGMFGVSAAAVTAEKYPGFTGPEDVSAMGWVSESAGTLTMKVLITGLEPGKTGGWHVHSGFATCTDAGACTCSDASKVGGHYYEGLASDPWDLTTYTADANGVAMVEYTTTDFSLEGVRPIAGRTLVVHLSADSGSTRAACGVISPTPAAVTMLDTYPGYTGALTVQGIMTTAQTSTGIKQYGLVAGLDAGVTGGWHVHAGYSCAEAAAVMGHYWETGPDPWLNTQYTSDASGVAWIDEVTADFTMHSSLNVFGRTIVVHSTEASPAPRAACGVIGMSKPMYPSVVASFSKYPGSTVTQTIQGVLQLTAISGSSGLRIKGMLTGLEPGKTGGWHVHSGFTCSDAALVGGHYYDGLATDSWIPTRYLADDNGVAMIDEPMPEFATQPGATRSVVGRVVVVHLSGAGGARAACGVIEPISMPEVQVVSIGTYPGYTGSLMVRGLLIERDTSAGLAISGVVGGLQPSVTGGWHVHSGYTCAGASGVGGHYFTPPETDPWLLTTYTTDASGAANVSSVVEGFTVAGSTMAVYKRSVVFHEAGGARAGCGEQPFVLPPSPPPSPPPVQPPFSPLPDGAVIETITYETAMFEVTLTSNVDELDLDVLRREFEAILCASLEECTVEITVEGGSTIVGVKARAKLRDDPTECPDPSMCSLSQTAAAFYETPPAEIGGSAVEEVSTPVVVTSQQAVVLMPDSGGGGMGAAAGVGIAIAVIAVIAIAIGGYCWCKRRNDDTPMFTSTGNRGTQQFTRQAAPGKGTNVNHQVAIDMHVHSKLKPNQA